MMRPPTKPSAKRQQANSSWVKSSPLSSTRRANDSTNISGGTTTAAAGNLLYVHSSGGVRPQVTPLEAPFFQTLPSSTRPVIETTDLGTPHGRKSSSKLIPRSPHFSPSPRRAVAATSTNLTTSASKNNFLSMSTSRLNTTSAEFGVTLGGKNAYFNFADGDTSLTATKVIAQERSRFEAFSAVQITLTALPSDLPSFVILQYKYREDYGKLGAAESAARQSIYTKFSEDNESIQEYERCKAKSDMASFRHSVAVGDTIYRKASIALGRVLQDEPASRVVIVVNEEKVRACLRRWQKVEMETIDLLERMQALQTFEERRRRVRVVEPEIREWRDIMTQIEESGLHRRTINPFGHCPFSGGGSHPDGCPFSSPRGCHGLPIDRKHFTSDHMTPSRGGTTLHLPPI